MSPPTKNPLARFDLTRVITKGIQLLGRWKESTMDKELRDKMREFKRRSDAGEAKVVSQEEAHRRLSALRAELTDFRKRLIPK